MGPKKFFKSKLAISKLGNFQAPLSNFCMIVDESEMKFASASGQKMMDLVDPFFMVKGSFMQKTEDNKLGSFLRYENIMVSVADFFINIETEILFRILSLTNNISALLSSTEASTGDDA